MPRIRSLVPVLTALVAGVAAPPASAAIGDLTPAGCVAHQIAGCEQPPVAPPVMQAPGSIAASSDSRDLYVGGRTSASGAITRLRRDPATGARHFEDCIRDGGCTTNQALTAVHGVVASPDGQHVYALTNSRRIDRYAVQPGGALTPLGCVGDSTTGCATVVPTDLLAWNANSITMAPDGDHVYVSALGFYRGIAAFARDATTGDLTFADCLGNAQGCHAAPAGMDVLGNPQDVVAAPGGEDLYLSDSWTGGVGHVKQGAGGTLTLVDCLVANPEDSVRNCATAPGTLGASKLGMAPDGSGLYVGGGAVTHLARDTTTGALTWDSCWGGGSASYPECAQPPGDTAGDLFGGGVNRPLLSPDGRNVYVASYTFTFPWPETITVLRRDAGGDLSFGQCLAAAETTGCETLPAPEAAALYDPRSGAAITPDGESVSFAGYQGPGVVTFVREAHTCPDATASATAGQPLTLTCGARPGVAVGDPAHGTLSADRTTYTPDPGFTGTDTFTVRAAGPAGLSNVAPLAVTVTAGGPVMRVAPSVTIDAPRVGRVAIALVGQWKGATGYDVRWLRCAAADPGDCAAIPWASGLTHKVVDADAGSRLRAEVRALSAAAASLWTRSAASPVIAPRR